MSCSKGSFGEAPHPECLVLIFQGHIVVRGGAGLEQATRRRAGGLRKLWGFDFGKLKIKKLDFRRKEIIQESILSTRREAYD